jgi:ubiquinone/menaquinone biosynthesis C-methylase UbiE
MQQPSEFDKYAKSYHEVLSRKIKFTGGTSESYARYKTRIVAARLTTQKVDCILDLGCGDGLMDIYFRKLFSNTELIGLDVSTDSIAVAKERHIAQCTFMSFDGANIPLPDQRVDVVFMSCVLHHVPQGQQAGLLHECARVLKPGGCLFIFEHNPFNPITRRVVQDCVFDKDALLIAASNLKALVLLSGFQQARVRYTLFFPRHNIFALFHKLERYMAGVPFGGQYYLSAIKS